MEERGQGRARRGPKEGPSSKERVLVAAGHLFSRQGYAATSIDQIATRAQASPSSIYWHFKQGKEDILVAVLERAAEIYMDRLGAAVRRTDNLATKVDIFFADLRQQMEEKPDTLRLIMQIALERAHVDGDVRRRIQAIYRNYRQSIVTEMQACLPDEEPRRLERTAFLATGLLEGVFLQWQLDPDDCDIDGAIHLMRVFVHRLYGDPNSELTPLPPPVVVAPDPDSSSEPSPELPPEPHVPEAAAPTSAPDLDRD